VRVSDGERNYYYTGNANYNGGDLLLLSVSEKWDNNIFKMATIMAKFHLRQSTCTSQTVDKCVDINISFGENV